MSHLPGEAYIHRYNELIKSLTGAKGGEPMSELAPELVPMLALEVDRPEWWILGNSQAFGSAVDQAAGGVGTNAAAQWIFPVGAGVVGVVIRFTLRNPVAGVYSLRRGATAIAGPGPTGLGLDFRTGNTRRGSLLLAQGTPVVLSGTRLCEVSPQAAADYNIVPNVLPFVVMVPGDSLTCFNETANSPLNIGAEVHYERAFEASENKSG